MPMNGVESLPGQHKLRLTHRAIHVLVVDDYPDNAESMAMLLRLDGHEVAVALNGLAALQAAQFHQPDVVLLDIAMPGMDGYQVARKLRGIFGESLLLIAITAFGSDEARKSSEEVGFDLHLVKPVEPHEIESLLREFEHSV